MAPRARRVPSSLARCAALAAALLGCDLGTGPRQWHACTCRYDTHMDVGLESSFQVCGTGVDEVKRVAKSCAVEARPDPVQGCTCWKLPQEERCEEARRCRPVR